MAKISIRGKTVIGRAPRARPRFAGLKCPKMSQVVVTDVAVDPDGKIGAAIAIKHAVLGAKPRGRQPDPEFDQLLLAACEKAGLKFAKTKLVIELGKEVANLRRMNVTEYAVKWRIDALIRAARDPGI